METGCDLKTLGQSFQLALRAENKSPRTIETYLEAVGLLDAWLRENGHSTKAGDIRREHVNAFIGDLLAKGNKPGTASNRFRSLKTFFRWAAEEEEIEHSPMAIMKPPRVPDTPVPVLSDDAIHKLLKACEGKDLAARRDTAIIRLLLDSGLRRAELAGLKVEDVSLANGIATVVGKGNRRRDCPFGLKTAQALDRYLRARSGHPHAHEPDLWLGERGPLTHWGIDQIVRERAAEAKIGNVHLHQFRHTWAHLCQKNGMPESALMENAGWQSRQMVDRYAKSAAAERARNAHREYGPGDRF